MATQSSRKAARAMLSPTVILLLVWMIVPLAMTLWFSLQRYNLLYPDRTGFNDFGNYTRFVLSPAFGGAVVNTASIGSERGLANWPATRPGPAKPMPRPPT
mgnify:CR=1 FL=1